MHVIVQSFHFEIRTPKLWKLSMIYDMILWIASCCTFLRWLFTRDNLWHPALPVPHLGSATTPLLWGPTFLLGEREKFLSFTVKMALYTVHPSHVPISVTIQVLADNDEPKEREVVGRQRHSSVWASLVRGGRVVGTGGLVLVEGWWRWWWWRHSSY